MTGKRLARLAAEAATAGSSTAALRAVRELRRGLEAFERRQVAYALADGASFAAIARELGVSRQAVHRRFRHVAAADAPLGTAPDARRVLRSAREEAGTGELGSEHVLLAILRAGGCAVLHDAGATLDRARTQVEGAARDRLSGGGRDDMHTLLAGSARAARARHAHRIEVEDLLVAALEDPVGGASRTLRALGVDPAGLRAELSRRRAGLRGRTARA